jgi:hypothetical protein
MVLISMVRKFQVEHGSGLTIDGNAGFGAGGLGRPAPPWFEPGLLVGWRPRVIDFVGRLAVETHVRTELIVPFQKPGESSAKVLAALWNQNASSAFVFERANESLHHSDAAVLCVMTFWSFLREFSPF